MSGRANDEELTNQIYHGTLRLVIFTTDEVVTVADGSLPLSCGINQEDDNTRKLREVYKIIQSTDVTSFHLVRWKAPWDFKAGQYLPIIPDAGDGKVLTRTYSLSNLPSNSEYRTSAKHERFGQASRFLDEVQERRCNRSRETSWRVSFRRKQ